MLKKILFSLSIALIANSAMANTTIYTDDLGRMHFLGKDAASVMQTSRMEMLQKEKNELSDIIYKNEQPAETSTAEETVTPPEEVKVNAKEQHTNKSKGSFTFNKGVMDASDPYTYGETNIAPKQIDPKTEQKELDKKRFWDNWLQ